MPVMTIGAVPLHRIEELRIPNKIGYFTEDSGLVERNRHWLAPHFLDEQGCFDLVFQSWIFEADDRVFLIDPCTGNGRPHPVPFFDHLDVPFIERMQTTGFRPEDIDFVVCTHLHHDHCGWNTQLRDRKWVPTFPNARYIFQQAEYDRWGKDRSAHPEFAYNDGVFERSVKPVVEAGLANLVSGSLDLSSGVAVEPAAGHTLGHQMLQLSSQGQIALFTGDCFHHPIQLVEPVIPFGDSEDMALTIAMRRTLVERAANEQALLIAAHLPAPYAVKAWRKAGVIHLAAADANLGCPGMVLDRNSPVAENARFAANPR